MLVSQIEKAVPVYNRLDEISRELKLLATLQTALTDKDTSCIDLNVNKVMSVRLEEIEPECMISLIDLIRDYKLKKQIELQNKLESL